MRPEPKHILSFKTALTEGTIRAAANPLGLEPSTVSRNIAFLEKQFATALIERRRKGVLPTEAGMLLLEFADLPCGVLNKGCGVSAMIVDMEASHGFRTRTVMETGSIAALKACVRVDLGVTLLPEFVVDNDIKLGTLRARDVADSSFGRGKVSLFVRQGRRLPLAAQKLIPAMARSLAALNE